MERKRLLAALLTIGILLCGGWWFPGMAHAQAIEGDYAAHLLGSGEYAFAQVQSQLVIASVYTAQLHGGYRFSLVDGV